MQLEMMAQDRHWYQRYRPQSISEMVLPKKDKAVLMGYVNDKFVPSILLVGPPGTGKTSTALALMKDIGADFLVINSSMYGDIDTMRTTVMSFATSMSMIGDQDHKYVVFEEADGITPKAFDAVRAVFETTSTNCSFILTANKIHKIPEPIQQRCTVFNMQVPRNERGALMIETYKRAEQILKAEGVSYEQETLLKLVKEHFPKHRRLINELQRIAGLGAITSEAAADAAHDAEWAELFAYMRDKEFNKARAWIATNADIDSSVFYQQLYESLSALIKEETVPLLVVDLARYQYQETMAVDVEINRAACIAEIMYAVAFR